MSEVLEVEHKFLLMSDLSEVLIPGSKRYSIHQTYLFSDPGYSERVRYTIPLEGGAPIMTHTKKRPGPNGGKWEDERVIGNGQEYAALLGRQKIGAMPIYKVRYVFDFGEQTFELDHFLGPISFWLLEAEVESLDDPLDLDFIKTYLGDLVDVTNNRRFASAYIAKKPHKTIKEIAKIRREFYEGS